MSKKITNVLLIVILIVLMLVYLLIKQFGAKDRTFSDKIVSFETAKVTGLTIHDPTGKPEVVLQKTKENWELLLDGNRYTADSSVIGNILKQMNNLKTKQLAGSGEEAWIRYEVTDTSAIVVTATAGKKTLAKIYLGKILYAVPPGEMTPQAQKQSEVSTYVRAEGSEEVYTVEGMTKMNFNRKASEYRFKKLVNVNKDDMTKITFVYPDMRMVLEKQGRLWVLDGAPTDSFKVSKYTALLSRLSNPDFVDPLPEGASPSHEMTLEGKNFEPVIIRAYPVSDPETKYIMTSSINPGAFFNGGKNGLFTKVMIQRHELKPFVPE